MKKLSENSAEIDKLISELFGGISVPTEPEPYEEAVEAGVYTIPVRVGQGGRAISEGGKPWITGTYIPGMYISPRHEHGHYGVDLAAERGTPVFALALGVVVETKVYQKGGNTIKIAYEDGKVVSYYAHLDTVRARVGQKVDSGTIVGTVGDSGNAKGTHPHLHFEVRVDKARVSPMSIIGRPVGSLSKKAEMIMSLYKTFEKYLSDDGIEKTAMDPNIKIPLTDLEAKIFNLLTRVAEERTPGVTLRVAGGWVRDKLLGKDSNDIDIAVDKISGLEFASAALEWMKEHNIPSADRVTTVEANVEANKHMESAILPVLGMPIDFALLRTEKYDDLSRIPIIEVGVPPSEDAKRRDLTVNGLFYNIHTGRVEDYVGGVNDLYKKIARTPIDPFQTYRDDPLRLLRLVRFAAKFDLDPDPSIFEAAQNPKILDALKNKVSRERIWVELVGQSREEGWKEGALVGPNFHKAVILLGKLGLRDLLLAPTEEQMARVVQRQEGERKMWEEGFSGWTMEQKSPHHDLNVWEHTVAAIEYLHKLDAADISETRKRPAEERIVRNLAMLLHDVGKGDPSSVQTEGEYHTYHGHESSSAAIAEEILRDLKAPRDIRERVVNLIKHHMRLHNLSGGTKGAPLRRVVRDVGERDWRGLIEMTKSDVMGKQKPTSSLEKYERFAKIIDEYLEYTKGKDEVKPPITGKEIMETLGLKTGPKVGQVVRALKEKLLENPEMTKEEALEFIKTVAID